MAEKERLSMKTNIANVGNRPPLPTKPSRPSWKERQDPIALRNFLIALFVIGGIILVIPSVFDKETIRQMLIVTLPFMYGIAIVSVLVLIFKIKR